MKHVIIIILSLFVFFQPAPAGADTSEEIDRIQEEIKLVKANIKLIEERIAEIERSSDSDEISAEDAESYQALIAHLESFYDEYEALLGELIAKIRVLLEESGGHIPRYLLEYLGGLLGDR